MRQRRTPSMKIGVQSYFQRIWYGINLYTTFIRQVSQDNLPYNDEAIYASFYLSLLVFVLPSGASLFKDFL
jgi:hypothetical protein